MRKPHCPALTNPLAIAKLAEMIEEASKHLKEHFNVDTVLVFVDTIVTAAGYAKSGDENDAALAQRVMSTLAKLSHKISALVIGIDHFGKAIETGTRGSSAKEGHADVVLPLRALASTPARLKKLAAALDQQKPFVPLDHQPLHTIAYRLRRRQRTHTRTVENQ